MKEKMTFKIMNEKGEEVACEGLFTFEAEETKKNYLVYTDHTKDEEGNYKVYAAIYNPEKKEGVLEPIESDEELEIVQNVLEEFQKKEAKQGDEL